MNTFTAYHIRQSKAAQKVVASFAKQPVSLSEARAQVLRLKAKSRSTVKKGHDSTK